jgi:phosphotriesterase-related protein
VITVLGDKHPDDLGIVLTHEHLLLYHFALDSKDEKHPEDYVLENTTTAIDWLKKFGQPRAPFPIQRTIVELSSRGLRWENAPDRKFQGPDYPNTLADLSRRSGVNIVMGTSYYKKAWHPQGLSDRRVTDIADEIVNDIAKGVAGTTIRAGIIGEVGVSAEPDGLSGTERNVVIASALAQRRTGAAINFHFDTGGGGLRLAQRLEVLKVMNDLNVPLGKVIFSHLVDLDSPDLARRNSIRQELNQIADSGVYLGFDTFKKTLPEGTRNIKADANREAIRDLWENYNNRILISQDTCNSQDQRLSEGYTWILQGNNYDNWNEFTSDQMLQMLVSNPKKVLAITKQVGFKRVGFWPGNGDSEDKECCHHHGETYRVTFAPGTNGQAFKFNGESSYVRIPNFEQLDSRFPFQVSLRFNAKDLGNRRTLLDKSHGNGTGWAIQISPERKLAFGIGLGRDPNDYPTVVSDGEVQFGAWQQAVMTYRGNKIEISLNGQSPSYIEVPCLPAPNSDPLWIGRFKTGGVNGRYFGGLIESIEISSSV